MAKPISSYRHAAGSPASARLDAPQPEASRLDGVNYSQPPGTNSSPAGSAARWQAARWQCQAGGSMADGSLVATCLATKPRRAADRRRQVRLAAWKLTVALLMQVQQPQHVMSTLARYGQPIRRLRARVVSIRGAPLILEGGGGAPRFSEVLPRPRRAALWLYNNVPLIAASHFQPVNLGNLLLFQ